MTKRFLARLNIIALCEKAQKLEVECGYAAHRLNLQRNRYTVDPVFRPCAKYAKAQRARAKAERLAQAHWGWKEGVTAFWVRHAPAHLVY